MAVLCVTLPIISLDNTVLNVALPTIVRDLGASSSQLQWMVDAYAVRRTASGIGECNGTEGQGQSPLDGWRKGTSGAATIVRRGVMIRIR